MPDTQPGTVENLKRFLSLFEVASEEQYRKANGAYFYDISLPFRDLNREIVAPGTSTEIPQGAVGIRCDSDFWCVAFLPYCFHGLSCEEIAKCLWPDVTNLSFLPDSGDHWWTAIHDENLEVPGEPHELWVRNVYTDGRPDEHMRFNTHAFEESARQEAERRALQDGDHWYVMSWQNGARSMTWPTT
jgi:hypothetical protein